MPKIIYRIFLLLTTAFLGFLIISFRVGGVVPEDFVNSEIPEAELTFDTWQTYGSTEWGQLAQKMLNEGNMALAEKAARKALAVDPTNGGAVGILITLYASKQDFQTADYLISLGSRLWPATYKRLMEQHAAPTQSPQ